MQNNFVHTDSYTPSIHRRLIKNLVKRIISIFNKHQQIKKGGFQSTIFINNDALIGVYKQWLGLIIWKHLLDIIPWYRLRKVNNYIDLQNLLQRYHINWRDLVENAHKEVYFLFYKLINADLFLLDFVHNLSKSKDGN